MTRWQRLKRRRRVRSILYGLRSYRLAEVVGHNPRYTMHTSYVCIAKPLLADPTDQLAHLVADTHYRTALRSAREQFDIGPDRQMRRTVTYD